jgi:hypothetical protein
MCHDDLDFNLCIVDHHHQPINAPTAEAQALIMDYT